MIVGGVVVVLIVVVVVTLGVLNPPRKGVIASDRLGPEQGEQVADYLARAADSLMPVDGARYALASLSAEITPSDAARLAGDLRVSQVLYRVPMPRVQTPLVVVGVGAGSEPITASAGVAAAQLSSAGAVTDRAAQVNAASIARLGQGCACVVALTVRGATQQLVDLSHRAGVRAVEALPPDAVFGRFAVTPLLPEQVGLVTPGPDDGAVLPN
ncbi:hypothetical protein FOY51_11860 [Antrihabitans cavernicola]|uniref:Uncharacterized protein n=1 Tax=Antrihabitans cavernicola TaxID=2495913 RepID=A0A5A7SES1_9NOCA|nr:hypothetical protein FOY51_11860 [Spelaeibacter cavernicola]